MGRIEFPKDKVAKGSQKWLQVAVETRPDCLQPPSLPALEWVSPRADDSFAEYLDAAFLERLGLGELASSLGDFWPASGPRWDGLARVGSAFVLVEAKAHLDEAISTPSMAAATSSRDLIKKSLTTVKSDLGADDRSDWSRVFYQYANRLAHLWWLRKHRIEAHLLLVGFLNDRDRKGPSSAAEWHGLYLAADHALGLPRADCLQSDSD